MNHVLYSLGPGALSKDGREFLCTRVHNSRGQVEYAHSDKAAPSRATTWNLSVLLHWGGMLSKAQWEVSELPWAVHWGEPQQLGSVSS